MRRYGLTLGLLLGIAVLVVPMHLLAQQIPYTLEDRERLVRIETKLEEMNKRFAQRFAQIDQRFAQIDQRFGQLITLFLGIVGAFTGVVAATIGFAIWDRRTALTPALRRSQSLEERQDRVERALQELAADNPKMAEVLRRVGLL